MKKHLFSILIALTVLYWGMKPSKTGGWVSSLARQIEAKGAERVFLGNSVLRAGIDPERVERAWGISLCQYTSNGSASAFWYLYVKNVLGAVNAKPKECFIFFRDTELTDPKFRTEGTYLKPLRLLSKQEEPLFHMLVGNTASWKSEFLASWKKRAIKTTADLLGVNKRELREAIANTFSDDKMRLQLLSEKQLQTEAVLTGAYQFEARLNASFLPAILQELKQQGIHPVFVRHKRVREAKKEAPPEGLIDYINSLQTYLEKSGAGFYDLSYQDAMTPDLYGAGDHLTPEGKQIATEAFLGFNFFD